MKNKNFKLEYLLTVICLSVLILLMCTIVMRFLTRQLLVEHGVNNAFTKIVFFDNPNFDENFHEPLISDADWQALYPFPDEAQKKVSTETAKTILDIAEDINRKIYNVELKIKTYASDLLVGYRFFLETTNKFKSLIGWDIVSYSEYNGVIMLADGYLTTFIPEYDVTEVVDSVIAFDEYCAQRDIDLLFVLPTIKINQHEDAGVYGITDFSNQNADDFLAKISSAGVETLDLRETALEEGLTRSDLFYRTDHHWRAETGLWASRHVLKILKEKYGDDIDALSLNSNCFTHVEYSEWFLGSQGKKVTLARTVPDDFVLLYPKYQTKLHYEIPSLGIDAVGDLSVTYDMSHVEKKDYYNQNAYVAYNHGDQALIKIENMLNAGNLKLLILHDSFAGCVVPFVALGVKQVDALDLRHYTGSVQAYIEDTSPDAVIVMNSAELIHGAVDWSSHKDLFDFR